MAVNNPYIWGTGRRKTSTARVRIKPGTGKFLVNGREFDAFFVTDDTRRAALQPLVLRRENENFDRLLRDNGLLTRDSREVERKKYGRHKARRSTQFSKR